MNASNQQIRQYAERFIEERRYLIERLTAPYHEAVDPKKFALRDPTKVNYNDPEALALALDATMFENSLDVLKKFCSIKIAAQQNPPNTFWTRVVSKLLDGTWKSKKAEGRPKSVPVFMRSGLAFPLIDSLVDNFHLPILAGKDSKPGSKPQNSTDGCDACRITLEAMKKSGFSFPVLDEASLERAYHADKRKPYPSGQK